MLVRFPLHYLKYPRKATKGRRFVSAHGVEILSPRAGGSISLQSDEGGSCPGQSLCRLKKKWPSRRERDEGTLCPLCDHPLLTKRHPAS